jgi:hypothetical protein
VQSNLLPEITKSNNVRAQRALLTLTPFYATKDSAVDLQASIKDLLTDLRHLCMSADTAK